MTSLSKEKTISQTFTNQEDSLYFLNVFKYWLPKGKHS